MKLIHTSDLDPGFRRHRRGKGFVYRDPEGAALGKGEHLDRIEALAIPPAYEDVWICLPPNGHLQATGRDARLRKQYRYHEEWLQRRNLMKFESLLGFAEKLPGIRGEIDRLLRKQSLQREQVAALAIAIIDRTGARVGNAAYRDQNGTYGITTLANRHAEMTGRRLKLRYKGKHGRKVELAVDSPSLARRLTKCKELPGQALFEYQDEEGGVRALDSADVNELLHGITGDEITAKTFRTWRGSLIAFEHLLAADPEAARKKSEVAAVRAAAAELHNTMATSRKYYVHPGMLDAWLEGEFPALLAGARASRAFPGLDDANERLFARFLKQLQS